MDDIRRQVVIAIRWLPLVVLGALVAGTIAYLVTSGQPKAYAATAKLVVDPGPAPSAADLDVAAGYVELYARQTDSPPVLNAVVERLGLDETGRDVRDRVTTQTAPDELALEIDILAADPEAARVLALAVGDEMIERSSELVLTDEVREAEEAIAANERAISFSRNRLNALIRKPDKSRRDRDDIQALFAQISVLQAEILRYQPSARSSVSNRLVWFERPTAPGAPAEPRPMYWTMLALVAGGMLGGAAGFVLEFLKVKVRDERDLEEATGATVLGAISERRGDIRKGDPERLVVLRHPHSQDADAYRTLRVRILLASGSARTLLVAGVDYSDGHSTVAANLAVAYAEAGQTVILVDADLRSPHLHTFFGVPNERGLSILLTGNEVPLTFVTVPTSHPRLRLMPAGPASVEASALLVTPQVPGVLERLLQTADMVVVDGPSLAANLDAAMLATYLETSIVVIPSGSRIGTVNAAAQALQSDDARYSGAVLYRTVRGSLGRADPRPLLSLPVPRIAQLSPQTTPRPNLETHPPNGQPELQPDPSNPPPHQSGSAYLLVAALYRIVRGPHARPVAEPETRPVNGRSASTDLSNGAVGGRPVGPGIVPGAQQNGQGGRAAPWPDQSRPPVAVPVDAPVGVSTQPYIGPYAGGFKPGPDA